MSTVVLDTITGKSTATTITIGSTPVVSASANSMTIRGEGSNQTSIQQGLNKQWATWNASQAIQDSFNTSGVTDTATGKATVGFSTAMNNINYAIITAGSNGNASATIYSSDPNNPATGSYICNIFFASNGTAFGLADRAHNYSSVNGDLA